MKLAVTTTYDAGRRARGQVTGDTKSGCDQRGWNRREREGRREVKCLIVIEQATGREYVVRYCLHSHLFGNQHGS